MKPSVVAKCKKEKQLLKLDLTEKYFLPKKFLFIDLKAKNIVDKLDYENVIVVEFPDCVMKVCGCGLYLQNKLPLENDTLKGFTTIDPPTGTSPKELVLTRLLSLPSLVSSVLNEDDEECSNNIRTVMVDSNLPSANFMVNDKEQDVDYLKLR